MVNSFKRIARIIGKVLKMAKTKEVQPLFAESAWVTGLSAVPVFIDGLSHSLFYQIVATKAASDRYEAVAIGKFGSDCFKVKFYGDFESWGFTEGSLAHKFRADSFLSRADEPAGYERYYTDSKGVTVIMEALAQTRGVVTCPLNGVFTAFNTPFYVREQVAKIAAPKRGADRPLLPYSSVPLLTTESIAA